MLKEREDQKIKAEPNPLKFYQEFSLKYLDFSKISDKIT
jgi:hypothetical protein